MIIQKAIILKKEFIIECNQKKVAKYLRQIYEPHEKNMMENYNKNTHWKNNVSNLIEEMSLKFIQ